LDLSPLTDYCFSNKLLAHRLLLRLEIYLVKRCTHICHFMAETFLQTKRRVRRNAYFVS